MSRSYFTADEEFVQGNTPSISQTWSTGGTAVDVSGWSIYFKAEAKLIRGAAWTTDTISVAPASVVKSDSGSGTTDTFTIPFSASATNVDPGKYEYEIMRKIGADVVTITKGTLTITERLAEAT